jgi:hypothetical protein
VISYKFGITYISGKSRLNIDLKEMLIATLQGQLRTSDQIASIKSNLRSTKAQAEANTRDIAQLECELEELRSGNQSMKRYYIGKNLAMKLY